MGKKGDLLDFERGMVVGWADLNISETADILSRPSRSITESVSRSLTQWS